MKGYYYYAPYIGDVTGYGKLRRSETLKNARKGLRKWIFNLNCESGVILNSNDIPTSDNRLPKNLVGYMYVRVSKKKVSVNLPNGKTVQSFRDDYYYVPKGKRKGKLVMSDGSLKDM